MLIKFMNKAYIIFFIAAFISMNGCISSIKNKKNPEKKQDSKTAEIQQKKKSLDIKKPGSAEIQPKPEPVYIPEGNSYYDFIISKIKNNHGNNKQSLLYLVKAQKKDPDSVFLKKILTRQYIIMNKPDKAKPLIDELLQKSPENTETLALYGGYLAITNHNIKKLADVYKKIIKIDPDNEKAPVALAFIFHKMKQQDKLITIFEEALKKTRNNYFIYVNLGTAYLINKKYNSARKNLHRATELKPEQIEPKIGLIKAIKKLEKNKKNKDEIINLYNEILSITPSNIFILIELSYFYHENGYIEKSDNTFKGILEEWNINKRKITSLLHKYVQNKDFKKADFLSSKISKATGDYFITMIYGELLKRNNFTKKALEIYSMVKKDSKFFPEAISAKAIIYEKNKNTKKAVSILEAAIKVKKNNPLLIITLGNIYENIKNYKKAFQIYKKGIETEPGKKWLFYYKMGVTSDKSGKKDMTIKYMKKVLELSPDNPDALNYLGYTYADMGINLEKARTLIKKALSIKKNNAYIIDSLGWVTFKLGENEKALKLLKKANSIKKNNPTILEHIGDVYREMKNFQKAKKYYRKSLEKDPENKNIQKKVSEIESK